jgi:isopenicillin-N epimerase
MTTSPLTPDELRTHFLLDPDIAFLNHGSFGACPKPVFAVYQAWQRELEREPVRFIGRRQEGLLNAARERLAAWINAPADEVTFIVNATSGINVVARSLDLKPGDEVLSLDLEYGACDNTWQHLCTRFGARYVKAHIPTPFTTKEAIIDGLFARVTERTRVIYLSHITSGTAVILPVKEIAARARELGILSVIDGAHAPGQIEVDIADIGADFYTGNLHKWACAPKGAAFLHARPEHHDWVESLTISWGWSRGGDTFVSRNQQQGTQDVSRYLAVPAAIDFLETHNWPTVRRSTHERLAAFRERLHTRFETGMFYPNTSEWFSQMALVTLPVEDATSFNDRLFDDFGVEVPFTAHGGKQFVRVSVQGYVSEADLDRLENGLVALMA